MRKFNKITAAALITCVGISAFATGCSNTKDDAKETTATTTAAETTTEAETTAEPTTAEETTVAETTTVKETTTAAKVEIPDGKLTVAQMCEAVKSTTEFKSLYEYDSEDLMDYYGIDTSKCDDFVFCVSDTSPCTDTIALFQAQSQNDAQAIADALDVYLQSLVTTTKDYAPEEYDKVCNTGVRIDDSFVYLVISSDPNAGISIIESHMR